MDKVKAKKAKKYKRRFNTRLVKQSLSYSTQEIADLFGITLGSVNNWYEMGLKRIDDKKPFLVFGQNLVEFLNNKKHKRKHKCAPNEFYCCKCKSARRARESVVDIKYIDSKRVMVVGECEECGCGMYKTAAAETIEQLKKIFNVQLIQKEQL